MSEVNESRLPCHEDEREGGSEPVYELIHTKPGACKLQSLGISKGLLQIGRKSAGALSRMS